LPSRLGRLSLLPSAPHKAGPQHTTGLGRTRCKLLEGWQKGGRGEGRGRGREGVAGGKSTHTINRPPRGAVLAALFPLACPEKRVMVFEPQTGRTSRRPSRPRLPWPRSPPSSLCMVVTAAARLPSACTYFCCPFLTPHRLARCRCGAMQAHLFLWSLCQCTQSEQGLGWGSGVANPRCPWHCVKSSFRWARRGRRVAAAISWYLSRCQCVVYQ
jgi:hypothetical protein